MRSQTAGGRAQERSGPFAPLGRALVTAARSADGIAIGLCARVLLAAGDTVTARAHGRLEQIIGTTLDDASLSALAEAAERAAQPRDVARAETVIGELGAESLAGRSDILRSGFDRRLADAGTALTAAMNDPSRLTAARDALEACCAHREHEAQAPRLAALEMAIRLVRQSSACRAGYPPSFAEAADRFASDSASIDLGRSRIWRGESEPGLVSAYRELDTRLLAMRETENGQFAPPCSLTGWQAGSSDPYLLGVEKALASVVVPLASEQPVLLS